MWWCGVRGRCAQSPLCGAFGEGVSVVGWCGESWCCWELMCRVWKCAGEVSCLLKERGERLRQQSSEGGDDGEGVFAGEEEKKR